MNKDISKRYSFTIDTKDSKTLNNGLSFNHGDDITLIIKVIEDLEPKDLTGCSVDMVIANQSQEYPIIHRYSDGGITIEGDSVTIIGKSSYINLIGVNVAQLIISDEDQNITTQPFSFTTIQTLLSDDVIQATDKIDTLVALDKVIEDTRNKLLIVDSEISRLSEMASTVKSNVELLSQTLTDKIQTSIINADSVVAGVVRDEEQRKVNETSRQTSELERLKNEQVRRDTEIQRNNKENIRVTAENERLASERERFSAELIRVNSEITRNANENTRVSSEEERVANETSRKLSETNRDSAESERVTNENARKSAETARSSAETTRLQNENSRFTAEKNRITTESERVTNENARKSAETARVSAETIRTNNETARSSAEIKRQQAETSRVSAESDRQSRFLEMEKVYESSAGEVEENRKDYNGVIHSSMYEARKQDYETLDNKFGEFERTNFSGISSVHVNNSKDGLIRNLGIRGRTLQNLAPPIKYWVARPSHNGEVDLNNNRLILKRINGSGSNTDVYTNNKTLFKTNTEYTIILNVPINNGVDHININGYGGSLFTDNVIRLNSNIGTIIVKKTTVSSFVNQSTGIQLQLYGCQSNNANADVAIDNIIILEGDHVDSKISSTLNVEGIQSIGQNGNILAKSCSKNLYNKSNGYVSMYPDISNKIVSSNDDKCVYIPCKPETSYSIAKNLDSTVSLIVCTTIETPKVGSIIYNRVVSSGNPTLENYITPSNAKYLLVRIKNNVDTMSVDDIVNHVQIEEDVKCTEYESYIESEIRYDVEKPIMELPNGVCDEIIGDEFINRVGKVVLNGSEEWAMFEYPGTTSRYRFRLNNFKNSNLSTVSYICDKYPTYPNSKWINDIEMVECDADFLSIRAKTVPLDTFKQNLSNNPVTIYYEYREPIITTLSIKQLRSYDHVTNVVVEDNLIRNISADIPIDITSEIERNRIDFNNNEHNDMYKARMSDVQYLLDRINDATYLQYQDTFIHAENSYDGYIKDLTVKGLTINNITPLPRYTNDTTYDTTDGYRKVVVTEAAVNSWLQDRYALSELIKPNTTYTIFMNVRLNTFSSDLNINGNYTIGPFNDSSSNVIKAGTTGLFVHTLTTKSDVKTGVQVSLMLQNIQKTINLNETIEYKIMLVEGDYTTRDLSFFTGIKSVGDSGTLKIKSCSKNLYDVNRILKNTTIDSNGQIIPSNKEYQVVIPFIPLKTNTNYTFTVKKIGTEINQYNNSRLYFMSNDSYIFDKWLVDNKKFNSGKCDNLRMAYSLNGGGVSTTMESILTSQMEFGTVSTNYDSYKGHEIELKLTNPLNGISDSTYYDEVNFDTNRITRRIGVLELNKDTINNFKTIQINNTVANQEKSTVFSIANSETPNYKQNSRVGVCNSLHVNNNITNDDVQHIYFGVGINFRILNTNLISKDINGFKDWVIKNPTTVYYVLDTEFYEDIESYKLRSYDNTTNIFVEDSTIRPIISAKIPSNTQAIITNLMGEKEQLTNTISIMKATTDEKEMQNIEINLDQDLRLTMLELGVM